MRQLITPNPNIACQPGWCLQYVRQAFGLPARYGSATEAWEKSESQHRDRNFPAGAWLPVWYGLVNEPLGHVVLMAPDGSVYSTSDLGNTPHHHPDLADLEAYYAYYGMTLTYRGWTEDVAGYPVIAYDGISVEGSITPTAPIQATIEEDELTTEQYNELRAIAVETQLRATVGRDAAQKAVAIATENQRRITENQRRISVGLEVIKKIAAETGTDVDYDRINQIVADNMAAGVDVKVTVNGKAAI